jgi:phosphoribosylanthranilate isomerase
MIPDRKAVDGRAIEAISRQASAVWTFRNDEKANARSTAIFIGSSGPAVHPLFVPSFLWGGGGDHDQDQDLRYHEPGRRHGGSGLRCGRARVQFLQEEPPPFVVPIGIFVNEKEDRIRDIISLACVQGIQLHGDETPEFCQRFGSRVIKAFQVKNKESLRHMSHYRVSAYLLDSYKEGLRGGTGTTFDWHLAVVAKTFGRIILAGGLTPDNVVEAIKLVQPYGVDVCGGIEREKGIKDHALMKKFITDVRSATRPLSL